MACGATGVTVLGQLGEAPKLDHRESVSIASRMVKRMPGAGRRRRLGPGIRGHARPWRATCSTPVPPAS
jgi:hypothetical protein